MSKSVLETGTKASCSGTELSKNDVNACENVTVKNIKITVYTI